jgi:hypothetical protein
MGEYPLSPTDSLASVLWAGMWPQRTPEGFSFSLTCSLLPHGVGVKRDPQGRALLPDAITLAQRPPIRILY